MGREGAPCRGVGGSQHLFRDQFISTGVQGESLPVGVGIAMEDGGDGGGAGSGAAAPGLARTALPDTHLDAVGAFDVAPHQAGAVGEGGMALHLGADVKS